MGVGACEIREGVLSLGNLFADAFPFVEKRGFYNLKDADVYKILTVGKQLPLVNTAN